MEYIWNPRDDCLKELAPSHPNLTLISYSEQKLSSRTRRFLLTYEKHSKASHKPEDIQAAENCDLKFDVEFRDRYFVNNEETRQERKLRKALIKEHGRREALKRGKTIENGKVINIQSKDMITSDHCPKGQE